jgi:DNA polymerase III alpha subunit
MRSDIYSNIIFQEHDILKLLHQGNISSLTKVIVESSPEINKLIEHSGLAITQCKDIDYNRSIEDFDNSCQAGWFIPDNYKNMDIEEFLVNQCPKQHYPRLIEELDEFQKRNMIPLLRVLKYIVDKLSDNNVVWGVGRGSSVASYVLYLLGVHKIDSIKYNLDWREFLR